MNVQQEGVLELLTIKDEGLSCLDVDSVSPYLSIGMAKRGVQTYVENSNEDIIRSIKNQLEFRDVKNKISFCKKIEIALKFDFILLTQNKLDIERLNDVYEKLTANGVLMLDISNTRLAEVEHTIKTMKFSSSQIYIPFGNDESPVFILPREQLKRYYYRYWSWRNFSVKFWLNKIVEYLFVFKMNRLWPISRFVVLLEK